MTYASPLYIGQNTIGKQETSIIPTLNVFGNLAPTEFRYHMKNITDWSGIQIPTKYLQSTRHKHVKFEMLNNFDFFWNFFQTKRKKLDKCHTKAKIKQSDLSSG